MNCAEAREHISEFIDHRLDSAIRVRFEEHLSACDDCRRKTEALRRADKLLAAMPMVEPGIGFDTRLKAHLRELREEGGKPHLWQWFWSAVQMKIPLPAMAVVLIAVLGVVLYEKQRSTESVRQLSPRENSSQSSEVVDQLATPTPRSSPSLPSDSQLALESGRKSQSQGFTRLPPGEKEQMEAKQQTGTLSERAQPAPSGAVRKNEAAAYELVVRLRTGPRGLKAPSEKARATYSQSERVLPPLQEAITAVEQAQLRLSQTGEPETIWLNLSASDYELLKKELTGLGTVDVHSGSRPNEPLTKSSVMLSVKITILPPVPPN